MSLNEKPNLIMQTDRILTEIAAVRDSISDDYWERAESAWHEINDVRQELIISLTIDEIKEYLD